MKKYQGYGLVEVLISVALVAILLMGALQHYIWFKQTQIKLRNHLNQMSEINWLIDLMRDNIRHAGFTPCLNLRYLTTYDQRTGQSKLSDLKIIDSRLAINHMGVKFFEVKEMVDANHLIITSGAYFDKTHPIIIADCSHAEVNQVITPQNLGKSRVISLSYPLHYNYQFPIYVGEWQEPQFFIDSLKGLSRLYYQDRRHSEELSTLVKQLSWQVEQRGEAKLIHGTIELQDKSEIKFTTRVRT